MNYLDHIRHAIYSPDTYYRRYDIDLSGAEGIVKRAALVSLPFLSFYRPIGLAITVGINGTRAFSHLQNGIIAQDEKNWNRCALEIGKASLVTLSLATTVFHFSSGLLIITGCDVLQGSATAAQALWKGEYSKACEEGLQTLISVAYLSFMATGALEAMVTFALLQATLSLYQARHEMAKGRYLEGCAKLIMTSIRLNQANYYFLQIEKRNLLLRILRGRETIHLLNHPLSSLQESISAKNVVLTDGQGNEIHFGAHFQGHGGPLVKGGNLTFRTKIINGEKITELDFKVNHVFRGKLDAAIKDLKKIRPKEMQEILTSAQSRVKEISITSGSFFSHTSDKCFFEPGPAHKIKIGGLGTILIGATADRPTLHNRVVVRLNADQSLFALHEILSFVDLDQALRVSTKDEIERLKMGHLFRTFFPREATPFERSEEFFSLPLEELKETMIEKSPGMQAIFDTYYDKMKEEHLFDGRIRYRIEGLAEAARKEGAMALTAVITGACKNEKLYERVASMIRIGMLSREIKDANDFGHHGILGKSYYDCMYGGSDSVYTQLLTEKDCADQISFNQLNYDGKIRLLISLKALETGTYQYYTDNFGNRTYEPKSYYFGLFPEFYGERDGILEFIQKKQTSPFFQGGHEVMLKERVAPSFFKGLVVQNEKMKIDLIQYLRNAGIIQNDLILDIPVNQFIRVATKVTKDLLWWNSVDEHKAEIQESPHRSNT